MSRSIFIFLILAFQYCKSITQPVKPIVTGATQIDVYLPLLEDKNVGLLVNHSSLIRQTHLVDTLLSLGIQVKKVFSPEHGFRGQAPDGQKIESEVIDPRFELISLYGNSKKVIPEQVANLDVVIIDIQDVGVRFYTYASTMTYLMEACADAGIEVIVLDRPNPNGSYVDGPIMTPEAESFFGLHPIPVVHGLTLGELAQMIVGEGWLKTTSPCQLKVISVRNWDHSMPYSLPVRPSPNLPNDLSVSLYPSLAFFEGTVVSVGRGTETPFQIVGHPNYAGDFSFTPQPNAGSKFPPLEGKKCFGESFVGQPIQYQLDLSILLRYYHALKDQLDESFFGKSFYRWAGSKALEQQIKDGWSEEEIRASWQKDLEAYRRMRKKYLLYP